MIIKASHLLKRVTLCVYATIQYSVKKKNKQTNKKPSIFMLQ